MSTNGLPRSWDSFIVAAPKTSCPWERVKVKSGANLAWLDGEVGTVLVGNGEPVAVSNSVTEASAPVDVGRGWATGEATDPSPQAVPPSRNKPRIMLAMTRRRMYRF